jgi:hypothetical protein
MQSGIIKLLNSKGSLSAEPLRKEVRKDKGKRSRAIKRNLFNGINCSDPCLSMIAKKTKSEILRKIIFCIASISSNIMEYVSGEINVSP